MMSHTLVRIVAASVTVVWAFLVQGTFASDNDATWAYPCSDEWNLWGKQNLLCVFQYNNATNTPNSTSTSCDVSSRTLQRECTGFCYDGEYGRWGSSASDSYMCDASKMTCDNVRVAESVISGCKNLASPAKWTECPDCVTLADNYFNCLLKELDTLADDKCNASGGSTLHSFYGGWQAGILGVFFVWQYIIW